MIKRVVTGWTITRALFLILGGVLAVQSIWDQQWFGVAMGSYFAAMGLFAFSCASGGCFDGNCAVDSEPKRKTDVLESE